jgi:hypothetical protein
MARPMATTVYWGGDLSDDELTELSAVFGLELSTSAIAKVKSAYQSYAGTVALQEGSQPTKVLKQRLKALSNGAREVALGLGADEKFFEEVGGYYSKRRTSAQAGLPEEINSRVEMALVHLDIDFRRQHHIDLGCDKIDLVQVAWQLAQISRAADNAVNELGSERPGRPQTGARRFVSGLLDALLDAQPELTCSYDAIEETYRGPIPRVMRWFRGLPLPIRESESTLCKLASEELARRNKDRKGSPADN